MGFLTGRPVMSKYMYYHASKVVYSLMLRAIKFKLIGEGK